MTDSLTTSPVARRRSRDLAIAVLLAFAALCSIAAGTASAACPDVVGPEANFTYSPLEPVAGEPVDFTGTPGATTAPYYTEELVWGPHPSGPEFGSVVIGSQCVLRSRTVGTTHGWDFGDGASAAGQVVTHTFSQPGEYDVTITVQGLAPKTTRVRVAAPPALPVDETPEVETPAPPSNAFSITSIAIRKTTGGARLTAALPGPGKLALRATALVPTTAALRKITVGRAERTVTAAGSTSLTFKPTSSALRVLRKRGKLRTSIVTTYTPTGGTAAKRTRTVTLRLSR